MWLVYEPAALESELRGRIVGNSDVESPAGRPESQLTVCPSRGPNLERQAHAEPALAASRDEAEASRRVNGRLV